MAKPYKGKAHPRAELLAFLNQMATKSDEKGKQGRGEAIRALIADLNSGKVDAAQVKLKGRIRVQKFAGVRAPEDEPVEIQEFIQEA